MNGRAALAGEFIIPERRAREHWAITRNSARAAASRLRHGAVHQDDIGLKDPGHLHRLTAGLRLSDHREMSVRIRQRAQALPHDAVIVG
jgi:hypothetical protein